MPISVGRESPHSKHFSNPSGLAVPHAEQNIRLRIEPQRVQYLEVSSFPWWHERHLIVGMIQSPDNLSRNFT